MSEIKSAADRPQRTMAELVQAYAGALGLPVVPTLLGLWMAPRWGTTAVDMLYLPAVLAAAVLWGLAPALVTGIAAALAYNFFFTEPVHTFRIDRVTDVVTVVVLLLVALVTSRLAAGIRRQARIAAAYASGNATVAGFAARLLSSSGEEEIARTACRELHSLFSCNAVLVKGAPTPTMIAAVPDYNLLTPSDIAAAALSIRAAEPTGRGTSRALPAEWLFHPVLANGRALVAVGLARDDGAPPIGEDQLSLLNNLLDQLALALERARLEQEAHAIAARGERDRLRSVVLASIGTDLDPIVSSIIDAARQQRRDHTSDKAFVSTVESEGTKLRRYIANLIDLGPRSDPRTIEAGAVSIDLFHRLVRRDGQEIRLTPKEYAVLAELAKHRGQVLTHAQLLRSAWGPAQEAQTEYLRVAVRALRQKLEQDPAHPAIIINEPAVGYRLAV